MRFDSAEFLLFFVAVLAAHRWAPRRRTLLIAASYVFYASWNVPFLALLLLSTAVDFRVAQRLAASGAVARRRAWLGLSVAVNLGLLAYFKYVNLLLDTLVAAGVPAAWLQAAYVEAQIPLGISFYTFQTMSYTIDVYRRQVEPTDSIRDFALFVAFFPQLIAGPIIRAAEFIPQIRHNVRAAAPQLVTGLELIGLGLFQKVVVADTLALYVDRVFATPLTASGASLLMAGAAFTAQVYADFAGYSTMARGLAQMLGYSLPPNFVYPILSANPLAYRRGWHVTMGRWFRDYVYHPLGGDRLGPWRTVLNTMVVWSLFGLWHGASWNFLLWGAYNGAILAVYRELARRRWLPRGAWAGGAGLVLMPAFFSTSGLLFRAPDGVAGLAALGRVLSGASGTDHLSLAWLLGLAGLYALHWASRLGYREGLLWRLDWPLRTAVIATWTVMLMFLAGSGAPFIYFQF